MATTMEYMDYEFTLNLTDGNFTTPYSGIIEIPEPNLWCLALVLLPAACIFGNFLVVVAVLNERSLKTSTNFLLVSLACADLLVGTLVMPFSVYLTINRLNWFLPDAVCNFFCVADVSASTASIVHLVAISVDRFYAVVRHMEYKSPKHKRRVYCTILFSWVFSIGIGLPLGIGMNQTDSDDSKDPYRCGIVNPDYMLYMSLFAFYIPCLVMSVMYGFVFYKLHRRMRAVKLQEMAAGQMVQFGDNLGGIFQHAYGNTNRVRQASMMWAMPFLKTLEQTIAENEDMSSEELDELTTILHTLESDPHRQCVGDIADSPDGYPTDDASVFKMTTRRMSVLIANARRRMSGDQHEESTRFMPSSVIGHRSRGRRQSLYTAKQKIKTLKDRAIEILMRLKSKQGMAIRKETRATKLVATVMLVFLLCYMPFFTLNIIKVFMLRNNSWNDELEGLFIFFTWLGYVNSCLNPLIYSLFNRKFRATFQRLLHCTSDQSDPAFLRQKRLNRVIIGDSDERKAFLSFRSWIASQKPSSSPAKVVHQQTLVTLTPPTRNGMPTNGKCKSSFPQFDEKPLPQVAIQRPSTIEENDASNSRRSSLNMIKSNSVSSAKSSCQSISFGSERIQMEIKDALDNIEANESDFDAHENRSLECQKISPVQVIDHELIMLRKAQYSGYNILYDQIRDFNEPVEV